MRSPRLTRVDFFVCARLVALPRLAATLSLCRFSASRGWHLVDTVVVGVELAVGSVERCECGATAESRGVAELLFDAEQLVVLGHAVTTRR